MEANINCKASCSAGFFCARSRSMQISCFHPDYTMIKSCREGCGIGLTKGLNIDVLLLILVILNHLGLFVCL